MERYFNIGGPYFPAQHYMLPAMARLPQVAGLIRKSQYFVVHAQRQRVINGGGQIIREMALGKGALDLGVVFRKGVYPVEVKLLYNYRKSPEKAYAQVSRYIEHLGQTEGWLVVFDPQFGDWDAKLRHEDLVRDGRTIHVFFRPGQK